MKPVPHLQIDLTYTDPESGRAYSPAEIEEIAARAVLAVAEGVRDVFYALRRKALR